MEVAHLRTANGALENDILSQLINVTTHIRNLEQELEQLQQQITQIMGESNEMRLAAIQTQGNLELQIAQLQLEKQNLENLINQMRVNQ
jgi:regulator of replication initiation timing